MIHVTTSRASSSKVACPGLTVSTRTDMPATLCYLPGRIASALCEVGALCESRGCAAVQYVQMVLILCAGVAALTPIAQSPAVTTALDGRQVVTPVNTVSGRVIERYPGNPCRTGVRSCPQRTHVTTMRVTTPRMHRLTRVTNTNTAQRWLVVLGYKSRPGYSGVSEYVPP